MKTTFGAFVREKRNIGIDVETVRVIEAKALRKLRHPLRRHFFE